LDLHAQYVYLDKQQFEFPPHHWQRIGRLPGLRSGKWGCKLIRHGQ